MSPRVLERATPCVGITVHGDDDDMHVHDVRVHDLHVRVEVLGHQRWV
jgi:hypothetical protein